MLDEIKSDPSLNVLRFVENSTNHIESMLKIGLDNIEENIKIQFDYLKRERETESNRINALRDVDTKAVEVALAAAVKQAEVLRALVDTTAITMANALNKMVDQLVERIAALEKAQYENVGKLDASPDLQKLVTKLVNDQSFTQGKSGVSNQIIFAIVGVACTILTAIIFLVFKL